ncbi:MAG TPA: TIGR02678 family protein [Ilumatobacter sp.]|nr:TIGR02678 family protein [Ilumatobacter sp.]
MAEPEHVLAELRVACRHLVRHPLVLAERSPDEFALIRRHEHTLDRWFTQRLGYRLQVTADTARLLKSTWASPSRPLITSGSQPRPFTPREYTMLALCLAAVAAGPDVVSLRDLIHDVRSAATDADVTITTEPADRRALVNAVKWMVEHGLADEVHERVERYAADEAADAVLRIRPDRVALLPLPTLAGAETLADLLDPTPRGPLRAWMRARLLEDPVLYREDLGDDEWGELRRRLGDEAETFAEMFDVRIEARGEGIAVIDDGSFSDRAFPRGGTVGHAALLLLDGCTGNPERTVWSRDELVSVIAELSATHRKYWSRLADDPATFTAAVVELLMDHRLVEPADDTGAVRLLPAAWRYAVDTIETFDPPQPRQTSLL